MMLAKSAGSGGFERSFDRSTSLRKNVLFVRSFDNIKIIFLFDRPTDNFASFVRSIFNKYNNRCSLVKCPRWLVFRFPRNFPRVFHEYRAYPRKMRGKPAENSWKHPQTQTHVPQRFFAISTKTVWDRYFFQPHDFVEDHQTYNFPTDSFHLSLTSNVEIAKNRKIPDIWFQCILSLIFERTNGATFPVERSNKIIFIFFPNERTKEQKKFF